MKKRNSDFKGTPVILPDPFSTIDGVRVLSVIHSELSRIASELMVIFPPLQVAID
jgi:hypothetical protein